MLDSLAENTVPVRNMKQYLLAMLYNAPTMNLYEVKRGKYTSVKGARQKRFIRFYTLRAGYSKRFLESHRAEITLHKAAKAAFDEANLKKLPKVKKLDAEYSKLLTEKKESYADYRKVKDEMQELLRAQRNVELFFAEEKKTTPQTHSR